MGKEPKKVTRESVVKDLVRALFYLREVFRSDHAALILSTAMRAVSRAKTDVMTKALSRNEGFHMALRQTLEMVERIPKREDKPTRGRLFSHFYIGVTYIGKESPLTLDQHHQAMALIQEQVTEIEVKLPDGTVVQVTQVSPMG